MKITQVTIGHASFKAAKQHAVGGIKLEHTSHVLLLSSPPGTAPRRKTIPHSPFLEMIERRSLTPENPDVNLEGSSHLRGCSVSGGGRLKGLTACPQQ